MARALADRRTLRQLDWVLVASVCALATLGLLLVYSATSHPGSPHPGFHWRQLTWFGIGVLCAWGVVAMHYRAYDALAWVGYFVFFQNEDIGNGSFGYSFRYPSFDVFGIRLPGWDDQLATYR